MTLKKLRSKRFPDGSLVLFSLTWQDQQLLLYAINCDMCTTILTEKEMIYILINM